MQQQNLRGVVTESKTHVNDFDLASMIETHLEYNNLMVSNRQTSTPHSRSAVQSFPQGKHHMLSLGRKFMCRHLWHTPKILENLLESKHLVCSAMALKLYWVSSSFGSVISRHVACAFPWRLKRDNW